MSRRLRLADIFRSTSDSGSSVCELPGCVQSTRNDKPYCPDHVDQHPYVRWLEETLAAMKDTDEAAERRVPDCKALDANITVRDLVSHLMAHGPRTEERLCSTLNVAQKAVKNYSEALERRGVVERGKTKRGSTVLRLADGFSDAIWTTPVVKFDRTNAVARGDAAESHVSCNMPANPEPEACNMESESEAAVMASETNGTATCEDLESAQREHLKAAEELLRLRDSGASRDDLVEAGRVVAERWSDLVKIVTSLNLGSMAAHYKRGSRSKTVKKAPVAMKPKAKVAEKAPRETNAGRILAHLSRNVGRPVPAAMLIKHIHTKPKCSSMQDNLSSIISAFRRRGYRIEKTGDGARIAYILASTKPR